MKRFPAASLPIPREWTAEATYYVATCGEKGIKSRWWAQITWIDGRTVLSRLRFLTFWHVNKFFEGKVGKRTSIGSLLGHSRSNNSSPRLELLLVMAELVVRRRSMLNELVSSR